MDAMNSYSMTHRMRQKKVARIRIAGADRQGIIATITGYLFKNHCNIEDIDQRILEGFLVMNMLVDITALTEPVKSFEHKLANHARLVGCTAEVKPIIPRKIKNVAILVSKEGHCLQAILQQLKAGRQKGRAVVIIGNHRDLKGLADRHRIPFYFVPSTNRKKHEARVLTLLARHDIDLIVLARYMQILSPEFVFRHEGRIINIHPSLLPAFPGPRSYHQAYNKGVDIVGVTAHFATTDLDEGPIICQDCFKVDKTSDSVEKYIARGRQLESLVLWKAVKLFLDDRITLRRGKVIDSKKLHQIATATKQFYH